MELAVSGEGLRVVGGSCEELARRLMGNAPPAAAGLSGLTSAAAVNAAHAQIAAAGMRCAFRMTATTTKLTAAATRYAANEADSAARFLAVAASTVG
jgi:hypothetical protein